MTYEYIILLVAIHYFRNSQPTTICTAAMLVKLTFLIMTSNADSRCYTKLDWLWKNVEPIKFTVT